MVIEEGIKNDLYTEGKITDVDIEPMMKNSFLDYSMSVIVSRALPDVRDGLKPVHRRILYTMGEKGLTHDKPYHKSADTVGSVLGSYHPHGDASVYDAMVRLAQDFSMRYPLVDPQGNFGSVDGDPPAAYRYTEARMSTLADWMLMDIDKNTVDYTPNYDGRMVEPTVLPSRIPQLLMNGSTGIAVGMATNIPPHNLGELVDGIGYLLDNPDCEVLDLCEHIKGPDFPTGGIIMGRSGIRAAYATGRGKIILRGRAEIEEIKSGSYRIVVTELPFMVNKARLIEHIADLVKEKRLEGIRDLRDESDREGMRIVVELKHDANPQIVLNHLYQYTQLQDTVGVIMLAIKDGEPKVLNLKEMLEAYADFQRDVIRRRTEFDLGKARERAHIQEGLRRAVDIVDEIIATIRACKGGQAEAKQAIMDKFGFDDPQAQAIVQFRLGQLAGLEILKIDAELKELHDKIADYEDILANDAHVVRIIKEDLEEAKKKFGDDRRTEIAAVSGDLDIEDLIPEEACMITATHAGYFKRQSADEYKSQRRGGRGISGLTKKDEDFVEDLFICSTHDYLLFITSLGRVYKLKAYEIPEGSRVARGMNIVNLLPLMPGEVVNSVIKVSDMDDDNKYLIMVTKKGVIKRTSLKLFGNIRKTGIIGITIDEDDEIKSTRLSSGDDDVIIATLNGMAIRFNETDARAIGRSARGVKAITLREGDEVIGMSLVSKGDMLFTVTEDGKGRLTDTDDYHIQNRGGLGSRNYDCAKRGVKVAGVKIVTDRDDVIMISEMGIIIRMHVSDIATQSRYGSGVKVMRLGEGDRVVTVARTERNDETDDQEDIVVPDNTPDEEDMIDEIVEEETEE